MEDFVQVPSELQQLDQWVLWKSETRDDKPTKIPYNAHKQTRASATDSNTWCSFSKACATFAKNSTKYAGIGFVFSPNDPYVGIDFDDCLEGGKLKDWAHELVNLILPTYTEISPSGNGIKMWIQANKTNSGNRKSIGDGGIEIYDQERYFTVTGELFGETVTITQNQDGFDQLIQKVWDTSKTKTKPMRKKQTMALDDTKLLDIAMKDDKFNGLWFGNWESNTDSYNTNYPSQSEADLALCDKLAFYWGNDFNSIDRMFRQSGLYREKWDRQDYKNNTIEKAIAGTTETYQGKKTLSQEVTMKTEKFEGDEISLDSLRFTDKWYANELLLLHGDKIRWCDLWGKWLIYDKRQWNIDHERKVFDLAFDVIRKLLKKASKTKDTMEMKALVDGAKKCMSIRRHRDMLEMAKHLLPVHPDQLDSDNELLNCRNGTIDLLTGNLQPHNPDDYITKMVTFDYDPENTSPIWEDFLSQIMPNSTVIRFLKRAVGSALSGNLRENVLFLLYGSGANGKTTFLETIESVTGDYGKAIDPQLFVLAKHPSHPTNVADLKGVRYGYTVEVGDGKRLNEAMVKRLTGRDKMKGRFMRQDFFVFSPTHTLFYAVNHLPEIHGTDSGIWRRILRVPFEVEIPVPKQDLDLQAKLLSEGAGILAWAVEGCLEWRKEGLGIPDVVTNATQEYRDESNLLGRFIDECCLIGEGYQCRPMQLYASYKFWAEERGEEMISAHRLGKELKNSGFEQIRTNSQRLWQKIGVREGDSFKKGDSFRKSVTASDSKGLEAVSDKSVTHTPIKPVLVFPRMEESEKASQSVTFSENEAEKITDLFPEISSDGKKIPHQIVDQIHQLESQFDLAQTDLSEFSEAEISDLLERLMKLQANEIFD